MTYCSQFMAVPNAGFSMFHPALIFPYGRNFIRTIKAHHRQIYAWTVNGEKSIDWCVERGVDGIITDDIVKVFEMYEKINKGARYGWSIRVLLIFTYYNVWVFLFGMILSMRHGSWIERPIENDKKE